MVYLEGGDGKTYETAMVLSGPKDDLEGDIYLIKIIEYLVWYNKYDSSAYEEIYAPSGYYNQVREYVFIKDGQVVDKLFIDTTILFHVWDK